MNILITINKKYIKQVNILLNSIQYSNTKESFNIYVLHRDLEESDLKIINNNLDLTGVLLMNLKALRKTKSTITPIGIKREKVLYNDKYIVDEFASATAIRKMLLTKELNDISKVMPRNSYLLLGEELKKGHYVIDISRFEKEIIYNLRKMSVEEIAKLPDVSEGLENSIKNAADSCNTLNELINIVKTKRFTQTRIQRILLYSLLGIDKKQMETSRKINPYVRVLGFNNKGKELISEMMSLNPKLNVVTSVKKYIDNVANKNLKEMLEKDILATNIYTLGYYSDSYSNLDYTNKIEIL